MSQGWRVRVTEAKQQSAQPAQAASNLKRVPSQEERKKQQLLLQQQKQKAAGKAGEVKAREIQRLAQKSIWGGLRGSDLLSTASPELNRTAQDRLSIHVESRG